MGGSIPARAAILANVRSVFRHPDKNDDPAAEDKFVEISKAYELLTDPERRKLFDTFGRVEEARPRAEPQFRRYDTFDDIFASSGFKFRFSDRDITLFHKLSITARRVNIDSHVTSYSITLFVLLEQFS